MAKIKSDADKISPAYEIATLQVAIYVAVGGGRLGREYAEKPKTAYIDKRVSRLPYSMKQIEALRQFLVIVAESKGLDPNDLPAMPSVPYF